MKKVYVFMYVRIFACRIAAGSPIYERHCVQNIRPAGLSSDGEARHHSSHHQPRQ